MHKTPMNTEWTFREGFDPKTVGNVIDGQKVHIPHTVHEVPDGYFDETRTQMVSTYQKVFGVPTTSGTRHFIRFEAVMARATVYLNGHELGTHVGGYTAFGFEVTDILDETNILTIMVDSREDGDHPPFGGQIDYLTYGGIYREVSLVSTGEDMIASFLVDADEKTLNVRLSIDGPERDRALSLLVLRDGTEVMRLEKKTTESSVSFHETHGLELWSLESPVLHTAVLMVDGKEHARTRFGARGIKVDEKSLMINGKPVFLRGLNRHQSWPWTGYAMPASAQREDADILKETLGVTIVRSSHYPPSRHFLDRCDEIGLLVFTELPGWQHIGDEAWKEHALTALREMMTEQYNHPSVVIIGTRINESPDDDPFYKRTRDLAKSIDTSRPTGGVRYLQKSHLFEDIYTFNDFVHTGDNRGIRKKSAVTGNHNPYLITEHNGHMFPTKSFDTEERRVEHAKRHFKVLDDSYRQKGVMGAIGWCMNDYHTHKAFGSNNHICHHGVMDMGRNMKYAASVYASQRDEPYMEVMSMMHLGDRAAGVIKEVLVATNCDTVEVRMGSKTIGTYDRKNTPYPHLPHPPIRIDDFVGNRLEQSGRFSKKDAGRIKKILLETMRNNTAMSLRSKIVLGLMMVRYKMTMSDAVSLYTTYVGGWGAEHRTFEFVGIKDGKEVIVSKKGFDDNYQIDVRTTRPVMTVKDTYDVSRVVVELKNSLGERAFYANEPVTVKTDGNLSLIGDATSPLQGGIRSFWVRAEEPGEGTVTVSTPRHGTKTIDIKTE
jgi:beta-galactosidase